jgi:hypothetical protein
MKKYILLLSAFCLILTSQRALACTGLVVQDGERVLVGNNEDWFNPRTKIWFIQPVGDRYGSVFFGFDNYWPQGGMNQKGLFFDGFALKPKAVDEPEAKPRFKGNLTRIAWRWQGNVNVNSLVRSTIRENELVNVALHHTGELDCQSISGQGDRPSSSIHGSACIPPDG